MDTKFHFIAERLRTSYWFIPTLMLVGSAVLAWLTIQVDDATDPEKIPWLGEVVYSGGPDGVHALLSAIATSMITVAGVVFSIAIVTLQLASTQFGPRMLANFVKDRGNQITLGTFVAAFLYSVLVLRVVRTDDAASVPHLSVTVALGLAVAGLVVFIYFVHHVATTIQAPNLVDAIADELRAGVDSMFPDVEDIEDAGRPTGEPTLPDDFAQHSRRIPASQVGYVQVVDLEALTQVAREHDLVLAVETRPGRFVVGHSDFVRAYPAERVTVDAVEAIGAALTTGARRTPQQDIEFPIRQMVEIAVRALSPAINDPFTAGTCVDHIGAGLCEIARRRLPEPYIVDADGSLRVVVGDPLTWERLVGGGLEQIRQAASFHTAVYISLLETLVQVAACVRSPERLEPLMREGRLVWEAAERNVEAEADQEVVEQRYDALVAVVEDARA
jgi:uncharacterized membrane protein